MPTLPTAAKREFIEAELRSSAATKERMIAHCSEAIAAGVDLLVRTFRDKHKVLLCGNGGSAADAQHIATEFVVRMNPAITRPGMPAIALTTDSSMLTAGANDLGYDHVFERAVGALGEKGDVLIGISTSGRSESVRLALWAARERGMQTVALLGKDGGTCREQADVAIIVPSDDTQRIQEGHITIGHILCALTEKEIYG